MLVISCLKVLSIVSFSDRPFIPVGFARLDGISPSIKGEFGKFGHYGQDASLWVWNTAMRLLTDANGAVQSPAF